LLPLKLSLAWSGCCWGATFSKISIWQLKQSDVLIYAGTQYTQQSYKVSDSFPFKWINKKWREGFYVTSMATAGTRWGVVMSRNAGFSDQVRFFLSSRQLKSTPRCPLQIYKKQQPLLFP
jgi:hypothetical protein